MIFVVVFVILINRSLNGYAGKANWAGIADEIGTQNFLVRLPFRRVGELIDAGVGGLRIANLNRGEQKCQDRGRLNVVVL